MAEFNWGHMAGQLGAGALQSWSNYRSSAMQGGMSEREAMLTWLQMQQQSRDARHALTASTMSQFLQGDEARYARDVDYTQYNPYLQQQALAKLQLFRGVQGAQQGPMQLSPDFSTSTGGVMIPRGGFNIPAVSPSALSAARADFDVRRGLALNPPGQEEERQRIFEYLAQMGQPVNPQEYPFYNLTQPQEAEEEQESGGGGSWWRRLAGIAAPFAAFIPGVGVPISIGLGALAGSGGGWRGAAAGGAGAYLGNVAAGYAGGAQGGSPWTNRSQSWSGMRDFLGGADQALPEGASRFTRIQPTPDGAGVTPAFSGSSSPLWQGPARPMNLSLSHGGRDQATSGDTEDLRRYMRDRTDFLSGVSPTVPTAPTLPDGFQGASLYDTNFFNNLIARQYAPIGTLFDRGWTPTQGFRNATAQHPYALSNSLVDPGLQDRWVGDWLGSTGTWYGNR